MTKIVAMSDTHGYLIPVPDCDLLLLGGDFGGDKDPWWLRDRLKPWVDEVAERGIKVVSVAGNHDLVFEKRPDLVPKMNWTYLLDSGTTEHGLKIWGSPWQKRFHDWAFNLDEEDLIKKWALIPDDTDVLLLHSPPYGIGDVSSYGNEHIGSPGLLKRIEEIKPKLVVFGHNHEGYGTYQLGPTLLINASICSIKPKVVTNLPIVVEL